MEIGRLFSASSYSSFLGIGVISDCFHWLGNNPVKKLELIIDVIG